MTDRLSSTPLRVLGTRDDVAGLAAINTTILKNGAMVFVTALEDYFYLLKNSAAPADGTTVVAPDNSPGRWFRTFVGEAGSADLRATWGAQTSWFVDPQNITGLASDENVGDTVANPLLTMEQLAFRISRPTVITVNVTATAMSDVTDEDPFYYDLLYAGPFGFPQRFRLIGIPTVLDSVVLTGATAENPAANTYETITVAGFDWTPYVNRRVQITAGGSVGGVAWVVDVPGAVNTAVVNRPRNPTTFANVHFTVGDTVAIERPVKLGPFGGYAQTQNFTDFPMVVEGLELDLSASGLAFVAPSLCSWLGCRIIASWFGVRDGGFLLASNLDMQGAGNVHVAGSLQASGCLLQNMQLDSGGEILVVGDSLHRGRLRVKQGVALGLTSALGCYGWTTSAVEVSPGGVVDASATGARVWGSSATAGTYGWRVRSGGLVAYVTVPNVVGALSPAQDVLLGGAAVGYGSIPSINPANNASMVER